MLLSATDISKSFNLRTLFDGVSLAIESGERIGFIGPNGAGKSTLLKIIAGLEEPDGGTLRLAKGCRAVYVAQQDDFDPEETARHVVSAAALASGGEIHDQFEADIQADLIMGRMGFDEVHAMARAGTLSGGWRKRLAIARALASAGGRPDLLLLDEPTNHLDIQAIAWLEELLLSPASILGSDAKLTSVFVTHDRSFLENVGTRIIELSRAYPVGTLDVEGNYTEFLRRKEEFLSGQAKAEQALANQVRTDLAWLARGPQARRTKSKSRITSSYERMDTLAELKGRNTEASAQGARVDFSATGRRTRKFIDGQELTVSMGGRKLFSGLSVQLGAGDCLGLFGPNGSGKSTLIRTLCGEHAPDAGAVKLSEPKPRIVVFSQHRQDFEPGLTLEEALSPVGGVVRFRDQQMHITAWSRRFLFRDEQLTQPIARLSGGELARIHIARLMLEPADVLILDEPTNDLDIPTLEVLEEALEDFPGAILLVTHDRAMMDRLATEVLWLDGKGGAKAFATLEQAMAAEKRLVEEEERAVRQGQRAAAASSAQVSAAGAGASAQAPASKAASAGKRKLTYKEQREYDGMEQAIALAEARASKAEAAVADPAVLADHAKMAKACTELEQAHAEVARLYSRWQELESVMK